MLRRKPKPYKKKRGIFMGSAYGVGEHLSHAAKAELRKLVQETQDRLEAGDDSS